MALDYKTAPNVEIGDKITSSQWNQLATAFNDRFLGGVGDPTYRLHWYIHSVFRALHIPSDAFTFAAEDEWWKFYSHIKPGTSNYPVTAAGLPGGINKNNPFGQFVFGRGDFLSEPERLNYDATSGEGIVLHDGFGAPVSDADHWEIGKYQRGVTDSTGEDLDEANALVAAQQHLRMRGAGFIHKGYGGFLPFPAVNGYCNAESEDGILDINLKFTKLSDESICTYSTCEGGSGSGTCPSVSKAVSTWGQTTDSYLLVHYDDTITKLPFEDYLEGPYTGINDEAFLSRMDGDQLSRAINFYSNDFRGSASERVQDNYDQHTTAFEFETFFTRQYYLAPSYGVASGYGDGSHDAIYPQFDWTVGVQAGYGLTSGVDNYDIHDGFVCAGFIAVGTNILGTKTFTLEIDGKIQGSVTIDADTMDKSLWFEEPIKGKVRIFSDKEMSGSEEAYCEIAEILEMKPSNEDAYLVLRMASANGTSDDGDGQDTTTPRDISDAYFRHGMIYNGTRSATREEDTHINRNPVYENMRRVCHDRTRLAERINLKGYEVVDGKSVFYFHRNSRGVTDADIWDGIAPSEDAIADDGIKHNITYIVESGTTGIEYNGVSVLVGSTFEGVKGVYSFTKTNGDEVVKQHDGIIQTAGEQSTDNKWSMFITTTGYKDDDGVEFKLNSYGDVIGWGHDRCATFSEEWSRPSLYGSNAAEINRHVTPGGSVVLQRSENPSGYRYLLGTHSPPVGTSPNILVTQQNTGDCDDGTGSPDNETDCKGVVDHYKSCQIYVPDYEIESVVMSSGDVKVTMTGRLRRNDSAPATVTNSSAGWDTYLGTETGPRTDENAVIEYLRWDQGSGTDCTLRIGDVGPSVNTLAQRIYDNGACVPRFYFTRQIPKVFEDTPSNTLLETHDTRMVSDEIVWLDLVLRAICEGFIDEDSTNGLRKYWNAVSLKYDCYDKRMFDYTYENLMLAANGNRWPRVVPLSERSDNPKMFGPMPDVITYAEHFNQISNAVNKLNRARLYIPVVTRYRELQYVGTAYFGAEGDGNCFNGAVWGEDLQAPAAGTLVTTGPWLDAVPSLLSGVYELLSYKRAKITEDASGNCIIETERLDTEYKLELSDLADYALPDDLKTLIEADGTGFAVAIDVKSDIHVREIVEAGDGWVGNGTEEDYKNGAGQYQNWEPVVETNTTECEIAKSGTLIANEPSVSDYIDTEDGGFGEGSVSQRNMIYTNLEAFVQVPLV